MWIIKTRDKNYLFDVTSLFLIVNWWVGVFLVIIVICDGFTAFVHGQHLFYKLRHPKQIWVSLFLWKVNHLFLCTP